MGRGGKSYRSPHARRRSLRGRDTRVLQRETGEVQDSEVSTFHRQFRLLHLWGRKDSEATTTRSLRGGIVLPFKSVNGVKLYYEIHGVGEPVIFGNGVFSNTLGWVYQHPVISKEYQVILYDMRGQGQSEKPESPYSFDIHAEDQKLLLDELGISEVHHVGISYGAELGLVFALNYPDMLKSLVVCSAVSHIGPLLYNMAQLWRNACMLADPELFYNATVPLNFAETFIQEQQPLLEKAKERYVQLNYPALVRLMDAFLELDITDRLPEIECPACVIAGEKDILKPADPYSRLIHERLPNSEMVIIRDSGHAVTFEKPEEFNSVVLGFLAKQTQ
ncbi:alpha/beta hydrolase [Candidatus Thorarchaeota archaeon]|nr:MAG: alpha/beta hydrolase [Candidatus Thorarchaeota archaeon]